jgi:hypothetical protein
LFWVSDGSEAQSQSTRRTLLWETCLVGKVTPLLSASGVPPVGA